MPEGWAEGRERLAARTIFWVSTGYVLGGVVMTYPLPLVWFKEVPGPPEDNLQFLWNLWWVKRSLLAWQSPLKTDLLYYPRGIDLSLHTFTFFNTVLGIPLQPILGLVGTYNLLLFISFPLSALGAFFLAYRSSGHAGGSALGGWAFAFSAYHMAHAEHHLNLSSIQFLPWYAWALERMREKPTLGRGVAAGLFFAAGGYCCWYYAVFMGVFTLLWMFLARKEPGVGRALLATVAVAAVVLSPVVLPMMARVLAEAPEVLYEGAPGRLGGDLLAYLLPGPGHSLIGRWEWLGLFYRRMGPFPWEAVVFLGWLPVGLALCGIFGAPWVRTRLWTVSLVFFWLLSLGPVLHLNGTPLLGHLPYEWIVEKVRVVRMVRVPSRFVVMCGLSLAVLMALGYARVESLVCGRRKAAKWLLWGVAGFFLAAETLHAPLKTTDPYRVSRADLFRGLKEEEEPGAVLELPMKGYIFNLVYLFRQTVHERPLLFGVFSRVPDESTRWIREGPLLNFFVKTRPMDELFFEEMLERLREIRVRFVVLNGPFFEAQGEEGRLVHERLRAHMDRRAEKVTGLGDEDIIIYRIPPAPMGSGQRGG